uniref:Uncharacterized protein n=2 Tax=Macaca TaxID=9539 RepID=A0A5F7ZJW8_MACMU
SAAVQTQLTALDLSGPRDPPVSVPQTAGTIGTHHHVWLIFIFFVETGFFHAAQAGLELLSSSDLPIQASQISGITGVSHCAWLYVFQWLNKFEWRMIFSDIKIR